MLSKAKGLILLVAGVVHVSLNSQEISVEALERKREKVHQMLLLLTQQLFSSTRKVLFIFLEP